MEKIIALIDSKSTKEIVLSSAIELARILKLEITICHIINAPNNWDKMSRSMRDNYPNAKLKTNEARLLMDGILGEIRLKNVKVKKRFLFFDSPEIKNDLGFCCTDLIVVEKKFFFKGRNPVLANLLFNLNASKLVLTVPLNLNSIFDIVLSSNFQKLNPVTIRLLNCFYNVLDFNLNLVYINTKKEQENSDISINNMKKVIATNGFSRTGISIFYSDQKIKGAELFANIKGGDLIVLEATQEIYIKEVEKLNLPILLINKCND